MGRPTTISDTHILEVAREVFLERGIAATTAEVARRAGVAEGSIFKRWPTKLALFHAALTPDGGEPEWLRTLEQGVGHGDLVETLTRASVEAIDFFRQLMPLAMMSWSNPSTESGIPSHLDMPNSGPVRALKKLAGIFEAEMRARRMAKCDAEVVARTLVGAIQHFAFVELLARDSTELPMPAEMFCRSLIHMLWSGLKPSAAQPSKEKVR